MIDLKKDKELEKIGVLTSYTNPVPMFKIEPEWILDIFKVIKQ